MTSDTFELELDIAIQGLLIALVVVPLVVLALWVIVWDVFNGSN